MHVVINAIVGPKQVNVGLTTVATVIACPLVSWYILDSLCLIAVIMYRLFSCHYSLLVVVD